MGLSATLITINNGTKADATDVMTSLNNLNSVNQILYGADPYQVVGHRLLGSADTGIYNFSNPVSIGSGYGTTIKQNHYFDGTYDRFIRASGYPAYQLYLNDSGVHVRKSNANANAANGIITWITASDLYT